MKNPTTAINLLLEHSRKYFIALESKKLNSFIVRVETF